jgi:hypothetical protein
MVCFAENVQENGKMFTYEWLGRPSESGIPPVLRRSMLSSDSLKAAITHAKVELKKKEAVAAGETYSVRIFNNDSVLVWTGNINDV